MSVNFLTLCYKGKTMKYAVTGIGIFSGLIALVWLLQSNDFFMYKEFAPKYEQARRETCVEDI